MHGNLSGQSPGAISADGKSAVERSTPGLNPGIRTPDGKSAVDGSDWFGEMARALLPDKPGTALHCITGYDERLCQRYAAGHVRPSAYFLRVLLRSEQGEQFLRALMDGCAARWWREHQINSRVGAAAIAEFTKRE